MRRYASESEYLTRVADTGATEALKQHLAAPCLAHFTASKHTEIDAHNVLVDDIMKTVNAAEVRLPYLVGDASDQTSLALMQAMKLTAAPTIVALSNQQILDTIVGVTDKAALEKFVKKFLEYLGDNRPLDVSADAASEASDDIDAEGAKGELAKLAMQIKTKALSPHTSEALQSMEAVIALAEEELQAEKELRKGEAPPAKQEDRIKQMSTATPCQITLVSALLLHASTLQEIGQHEQSKVVLDGIRKNYKTYDNIPNMKDTANIVEMGIVAEYIPLPGQEYALKVASNPHDLSIQLKLAVSMFQEGKKKESVALCLQVMRQDKELNDGAPIKILKCIFNILGPQDPITSEGQKKMMAYMF